VIDAARCAHIRHLFYFEHWRVGTIAATLGVHRNTVYTAIAADGWFSAGPPVQPTMLDRDTGLAGPTHEPHPRDPRQLARFEVAP
jgi:Putative ATPase subunit of terminase (gpP-like)